ncbi:hypothetical protein ACUCE8_002396 [Escherichia coli]|uniref:hypothetical protein n=1 Tax=Escherichia coli TaxID=562 RepID=UPI002359E1CC|nr:hypothetical protein [Escherichia coli]MDC9122388.1 hypothetical protein [Escherichia coli]
MSEKLKIVYRPLQELSPYAHNARTHSTEQVPEPEIDPVLKELLYAYSVISRARRYAGMAGVPLPLSLTEINEYLATHPVLIERDEFEAVIFALDDQYFQEQCV